MYSAPCRLYFAFRCAICILYFAFHHAVCILPFAVLFEFCEIFAVPFLFCLSPCLFLFLPFAVLFEICVCDTVLALHNFTIKYPFIPGGNIRPEMEILGLIERYLRIEFIWYEFGAKVKTPLCYFKTSFHFPLFGHRTVP
jgi:hypothetical protein